ncbi:anti-sigma factor antagonist [Brevibacillus dissolubilis]|uniref:anti-sigma factor antagonist n=1 Tax=Brevibacillus dissolubilis TaxID=1844116 RepID=UPI0011172DAB|nr:anti-sigma factor antagonist [Brevibacillus dissolubilis]
MNLTIRMESQSEQSVLYLQGELDAFTAPKLSEQLTPLVQQPSINQVIVDMSNVSYMDSTGIGTIVGALKTAKRSNCDLRIVNVTPRIERLFRITGLSEIIPVEPMEGEEA